MNTADFIRNLLERFKIEHTKRDRSGVYGFTQRLLSKAARSPKNRLPRFLIPVSYLKLTIITVPKMSKK